MNFLGKLLNFYQFLNPKCSLYLSVHKYVLLFFFVSVSLTQIHYAKSVIRFFFAEPFRFLKMSFLLFHVVIEEALYSIISCTSMLALSFLSSPLQKTKEFFLY